MVYTNDETDKSIRHKNHIIFVYVIPVVISILLCSLIFFGLKYNLIPEIDKIYGYVISVSAGALLSIFNSKNWLKMPDGSFHNVKNLNINKAININEPKDYETEYFNSVKDKAYTGLIGIVAIGGGVWIGLNLKSYLIPIVTTLTGIFLSFKGITGVFDKTAKLKIAKNGLWTSKLGFKKWEEIISAKVVVDKNTRQPQTILEIHLLGTKHQEANLPDERLNITELENKDDIQFKINNTKLKYNEKQIQS
jgi:hypothetical protein